MMVLGIVNGRVIGDLKMEVVITPDDDWFKNPLDSMPIATDSNTNRYHPDKEVVDWYDTAPSEYEPPMQDSDWFIEKPDESDEIEEEKTMHQKTKTR